jgi:hypothetical protein
VSQMPILSPSFWHYFHFVVQICFACSGQILAAWNDWFDAKDIQSVASNYIVLEPTAMDGKLFSTYDGVRISPRIARLPALVLCHGHILTLQA